MDCFLLQDWCTLQGSVVSPGIAITQPEDQWLDASRYQDLVGWIEVKNSLNSPGFQYQTAPTKDDALFAALCTPFAATGLTVTPMRKTDNVVPVARWVRWKIFGPSGSAWNITFRVFLAANRVGQRGPRVMSIPTNPCDCADMVQPTPISGSGGNNQNNQNQGQGKLGGGKKPIPKYPGNVAFPKKHLRQGH